jgi:hypothetical protein
MTNLTEQEVCIGSLGQQKVYLYWSDVKDICTNAVSEAYEQARKENTKLKELLKECREHLVTYKRDDLDKGYVVYDGSYLIDKINQVLGEE